jgi:hypothetical protein
MKTHFSIYCDREVINPGGSDQQVAPTVKRLLSHPDNRDSHLIKILVILTERQILAWHHLKPDFPIPHTLQLTKGVL